MTANQPPPLPFPRDHYFALSVAQPISTAYPRLPPLPAEQFIIPGDEEQAGGMGWLGSGCAAVGWTTSWGQEDSNIQVMCDPFHLTAN